MSHSRLSVRRSRWGWRGGRLVRVVSVGVSVWWVFPWWWRFRGARSWVRVWGVPVVALVLVVALLVFALFVVFAWGAGS